MEKAEDRMGHIASTCGKLREEPYRQVPAQGQVNGVVQAETGALVPAAIPLQQSPPETDSSPSSLLKSLILCARTADSKPTKAVKSLNKLRESVSVRALNDACPYSKFAHLTTNQAILETIETTTHIHIVDFEIVQSLQWAALLQAFATRVSGKPSLVRILGIPAPALGKSPASSLVATGNWLWEFAELLGLNIELKPILTPIEELNESIFQVKGNEVLAVNLEKMNSFLMEGEVFLWFHLER
ncbi:hypothetical protein IFM89_011341 [Coptis chinensis]|uniref:Uncharacterized protein n=1 Tax=Coptis chinensis TaxID=261450 RepID=A0A835MHZ4_9MAGN|nr:hypothetical protein IFM89_011341 [Coptis chinensis]